jgi:hypothetical protein
MKLSKRDWAKVDTVARELAQDVDRNELGKILSYAQRVRDTDRVLDLIERLPQSGYVRSGRTRGYLKRIAEVLHRELAGLEGEHALAVLAWSFRLLTTYQTERGTRRAAGRKRRRH